MPEGRMTAVVCGCMGVLALIFITIAVLQFMASIQPARIQGIPLFPGATGVSYFSIQASSRATCPAVTYLAPVSDVALVEQFYSGNLPGKGWVGGGDSAYPDPLLFVRKIPGHFENLHVQIHANAGSQQVQLILCEDY